MASNGFTSGELSCHSLSPQIILPNIVIRDSFTSPFHDYYTEFFQLPHHLFPGYYQQHNNPCCIIREYHTITLILPRCEALFLIQSASHRTNVINFTFLMLFSICDLAVSLRSKAFSRHLLVQHPFLSSVSFAFYEPEGDVNSPLFPASSFHLINASCYFLF